MIAKAVLLSVVVAATSATFIYPGYFNAGIFPPGFLNYASIAPGNPFFPTPYAAALPTAVATSSVVATPGAITSEKRVIRTGGVLARTPITYRNRVISTGLFGFSPLALRSGIIPAYNFNGARILSAPGIFPNLVKK